MDTQFFLCKNRCPSLCQWNIITDFFLVFSMQEQVLIEVLFSMNIITDFFLVFSMQEQVPFSLPMEYYHHGRFFINSKYDTTIMTWHDTIYWLRAILFFFTNNTIFSSWKNSKTKIYEYTQLAGKHAMAQLGLQW